MNGRPLVAISCSWIIGISIASLCQGRDALLVLIALFLLLLGLGLSGKLSSKLVIMCILALLLSYGERLWMDQRNVSELEASAAAIGAGAQVNGHIASIVEVDGDLVTFRLKSTDIKLDDEAQARKMIDTVIVRIKLSQQSDQATAGGWRRGDYVQARGVMELPGTAGNFGAFDYRQYLKKQGIYWQLTVKGLDSVVLTSVPAPLSKKLLRIFDHLRNAIGGIIDRLYSREDSGFMKGLVVGIRSDLDPQQFDSFARIGLTHVLAISGLHVAVVVYILLKIGAWLRLTRERTLAMTIAMMPLYAMITGASPSAVRACIMAMIALWLARRHALKDGLHLLLAAAVLMLIWSPSLIEDVSFQLSFIVTAGLILIVPTISKALPIRWKWLKGPVAVTLTAQLVSFPLTIYYFHTVHILSMPANFVLVPFISSIVMPLGMASIAAGALWLPMGTIPAKLATLGNKLTFYIVDWLNGFIGLRTVWPQPTLLWVACAYVLMGAGLILLKRSLADMQEREWWKKQAIEDRATGSKDNITAPLAQSPVLSGNSRRKTMAVRAAFASLCLLWLIWGYQPAWLDRSAEIDFINVGQGDSILIRTGGGKHILIDTGGTVSFHKPGDEWKVRGDPYEVGRKLLVPLLHKRGVRELDALVLTHFDMDHIGGAQAVLGNIPVRALLFNGTLKDSPAALSLLRLAADKDIPCYAVHAPMEWRIDASTQLQVLYPMMNHTNIDGKIELYKDQNDRSVVLLAKIYGRSFLLPGDLEASGEREIVEADQADGNLRRQVDVLKAGHHGSKTSTTYLWLNHWTPDETVISVGLNNRYGHPNEGVLERLSEAGNRVWRTDLNGEVQYRIHPDGSMARRTLYSG